MSYAEKLEGRAPKRKLVRKVYFLPEVIDFVYGANEPSRVVNLACCHLKHTMGPAIKAIERKFDAEEIEVITELFERGFKSYGTVYFDEINDARQAIKFLNSRRSTEQSKHWIKAFTILMKHCDLGEINCLVYMARFGKLGSNRV